MEKDFELNAVDEPSSRTTRGQRGIVSSSPFSPGKPKRKSTSLPLETVEYLKAWMMSPEHIAHPYPTEQEKVQIMADTGIELKQLTNWFVNNRKRFWKPRVEGKIQPAKKNATPVVAGNGLFDKTSASLRLTRSPSASSLNPLGSPPRAVSEQSSCASVSSTASLDDESDDGYREERLSLYVLRPSMGQTPSVDDVTTRKSDAHPDRTLRTFDDCFLSYRVPANATYKMIRSTRKSEIDKLKAQVLEQYLAEMSPPKRSRVSTDDDDLPTPRPKFRRVSIELWQEACLSAMDGYDRELPSLEEAAQLFGYATN